MRQNSTVMQQPERPQIAWQARVEAISALIAIALIAPLLGYLAVHHGNFAAVDTIVYDQALKARPLAPRGDVVVVAVDDASLAVLGRWRCWKKSPLASRRPC
jgi:CHASE2 domain-containing sensor protein